VWAHSVNEVGRRHALADHLRRTAELAARFAEPFGAGGIAWWLGLLHDAGKGHVRLHERVLYVLLARWPWLLRQLAAERGPHWRSALYRTAGHAVSGARLACEAGANARVTHLIRHHHCATTADTELLALIEADDRA